MMKRNAYTAHAFRLPSGKFVARVLKHGDIVALAPRRYATALNAMKAARAMLDKLLAPVAPAKPVAPVVRVPTVQWASDFMRRCERKPRLDIGKRPRTIDALRVRLTAPQSAYDAVIVALAA